MDAGCQGCQVASQPGGQSSLINEVVETWGEVSTGMPSGFALSRSGQGMRLTWVEQLLHARFCMKLLGLGTIITHEVNSVLSHSADGDPEARVGKALYPKSLSGEGAELVLEYRFVQVQSLCL